MSHFFELRITQHEIPNDQGHFYHKFPILILFLSIFDLMLLIIICSFFTVFFGPFQCSAKFFLIINP
ncbi:Uncharacterised protein [Mycobacterium tuberculosis]|nr:Uncharacterised protein [Mycobacterium tuberculosis]